MLELYDGNSLRFWVEEEQSYIEDRIGDLKTLKDTVKVLYGEVRGHNSHHRSSVQENVILHYIKEKNHILMYSHQLVVALTDSHS